MGSIKSTIYKSQIFKIGRRRTKKSRALFDSTFLPLPVDSYYRIMLAHVSAYIHARVHPVRRK